MMNLQNEQKNANLKGDDAVKRCRELYEALSEDRDTQEFLKKIPESLRKLEIPVMFEKGTTVILKDDKTNYAYFVLSGELQVRTEFMDGNEYRFSNMENYSVIADLEVLSGMYVNAVTVEAKEDTLALRVPIEDFAAELKTNIDFLYMVSSQMARKMFASSYNRGKNLYKRGIDKVISYLVDHYEVHCLDEDYYVIENTREEIASELGVNVRTVNRSIQSLKEKKMVGIYFGKIRISKKQYGQLVTARELAQQSK